MFIEKNCMPSYLNLCCWFDFNLQKSSYSHVQSVFLCSYHSFMVSFVDLKDCTGSACSSVSNTAEVWLLWDVTPCCGLVALEVSKDHSPGMLYP